jgi:orotidine-5'-phosphate decarboxylase
MLDLKLHDIPNTVTHAAVNAMDIHHNIRWVTVHIASGVKALGMATEALNDLMQTQQRRGGLVGITVLTSLDTFAARQVGLDAPRQHSECDPHPIRELVLKRARLGSALSGIVCSPHEVEAVRRVTDAKLIVPGIRPAGTDKDDQARRGTPAEAIQAGADYLVVGRAITDDRQAGAMAQRADAIVGEIAGALD